MRKIIVLLVLLVPLVVMAKPRKVKLFNGKDLRNWEQYLSPSLPVPTEPLFSVVKMNGEALLHITGEVNAALATRETYENYHLQLVFKWGSKVFKQFNSGILYHSYGAFGEGLGVWMSAHEFQLCTAKIGDSYCMGNSYFEIPAAKSEDGKNFRYQKGAELTKFGVGFPAKNCSKGADHEKPAGEWNVVDLYCFGRKSVHVVNGVVNMVNDNSGRIEADGKVLPLTRGKIQLQSEGGELFIRSVTIEKISEIPVDLLQ